ncbi:Protein of unknown function [Lactobacillus equicursoris DSM 19284 = JCM 14600 = CIP 110162]|uniref:Uncharacterized protein n=1 Tax=Lactobacillus equicursoris DSM 19284 = JCM 14600 = CIP 110162 TaxID=1293597 RepID=K0NX61_9LACO|nr:hypothetical protein [Lactobacillus equicursoris]KRL01621.1 hypothetical protein FC20_GL000795 [Lactobacillus equicursoris DSM 19284 = JCM 14600 = CIP 110162]CCK85636.1 Protein of unknown function [Lactobacillus equicursoris DSM 19284 = JCM 14600 = CIP 110162]
MVKTADSLEELANKLGIPAENLVKSVETWNKYAAEGRDPEFERTMGVDHSMPTPTLRAI